MAQDTLGETIDIHGGGRDLMFPHHENEIAQSEACTGKQFAKYWSHCGLIKINGEKMSKSLGNSLTIRETLKKYNYEVVKYVMFSKHYTTDINITDDDFKLAESHLYYFYNTILKMQKFIQEYGGISAEESLEDSISSSIKEKFIEAMDDDFNSSAAIANLHTIFKYVNNMIENANKTDMKICANTVAKMLEEIKETYKVLGFFEQQPEKFLNEMRGKYLCKMNLKLDEIEEKIKERSDAKKNKNYELADKIRENLEKKGIILFDGKNETTWDIKELY